MITNQVNNPCQQYSLSRAFTPRGVKEFILHTVIGYSYNSYCVSLDDKVRVSFITTVGVKLIFSRCMIIMYGFWDSLMTTPGLKSTHRSCGWSLVKSLDRSLLKTPYECFMWYLTDVLLNTEEKSVPQNTHHLWSLFVEVTCETVKVTRGFYFGSKFN